MTLLVFLNQMMTILNKIAIDRLCVEIQLQSTTTPWEPYIISEYN